MKYYFIAGEKSGDLHGSNLIHALKKKTPEIQLRGIGGDDMEKAGMSVLLHYRNMAFMGFWEVFKNLRTISRYIKKCKKDILDYDPDVIVLIDYAGFNLKIAEFAAQKGIPVFYYISPKVWAWNQKRAVKIKRLVDRMFVILPFEKEFYKKYDWDVDYVGSPVLDAIKKHNQRNDLENGHSVSKQVALLPGSRAHELEHALPIFDQLAKRFKEVNFAVAAVDNLDQALYQGISENTNVELIFGNTYDLLCSADAAIVTSGTATLETALFKVPQIVTYRISNISYQIAKSLIKVDYISLVNLIADKPVVRELIQKDFNLEELTKELKRLLEDEAYKENMLREYDDIYNKLDEGFASDNAATLMIEYQKNLEKGSKSKA